VSDPYENYPAMKAGILAGDRILEVDGRAITQEMGTDDVSKMLKGQSGTVVKVKLVRGESAPQEYTLTREEIKIPDVPYKGMIDTLNHVGYVRLGSFTQTAGQEVRKAMEELKGKGATKLVLDLRGNGGGLLREAVNIVNFFVPKGTPVVESKGRIPEWNKSYRALSEPLDATIPLVVLVDEQSASASEIVSGTLQDLDRAVIVGERTYGKGLVQQTRDLLYNNKLKVTVAYYYTPSGRCVQKLDYGHRDSTGMATHREDTALVAFKTTNGRTVYDGSGIWPDREVELPEMPKVIGGLYTADLFFDYATRFRATHATIPEPEVFRITEEIWSDFLAFAKDKQFTYETESMEVLAELEETAKRERYYDHVQPQLEALKTALAPDKEEEFKLFRHDIEDVLRDEIVGRYHFQTGRARAALANDPYLKEALAVINDPAIYSGILKGTTKP
jgi:carboxyl-terminal processing protease